MSIIYYDVIFHEATVKYRELKNAMIKEFQLETSYYNKLKRGFGNFKALFQIADYLKNPIPLKKEEEQPIKKSEERLEQEIKLNTEQEKKNFMELYNQKIKEEENADYRNNNWYNKFARYNLTTYYPKKKLEKDPEKNLSYLYNSDINLLKNPEKKENEIEEPKDKEKYDDESLVICNVNDNNFDADKKNNGPKPKVVTSKERKYNFYFKANNDYFPTCFYFSIQNYPNYRNWKAIVKLYIKQSLIFILYAYLLTNITVFIQLIYEQYADNIFKLCIMPLISMLVINLFITSNLQFFLTAIVLYYRGKVFLTIHKLKLSTMDKLLKMIFVNDLAYMHYESIDLYKMILKKKRKLNNY